MPVPGPGEVLIEHTAIGLNFIDVYFRTGLYPSGGDGPFVPGGEAAGKVLDVGPGVDNLKKGDRVAYVTRLGAYCERRVIDAKVLVKIPDDVTDEQAAGMMLKGMTAEYLLRRTFPVKKGDTVLYHAAAGGVGLILGQWAKHLGATVIGITGSVGKTSVKDITRALLPGKVHASAENFNTEIGLPLTILESPAETETLVLEMAMRGEGQIAELARFAEPDIGVITNVGPVHVELLGSIEAVAAAKAELIVNMKPEGVMIVPYEAGYLDPHLDGVPGLVRFGGEGDVRVIELAVENGFTRARIETLQGSQAFEFPFAEPHNLTNSLAAIGAGVAAGFSPAELAVRADAIAFSRFRNEHIDLGERGLIINDCYNANPVSMRAALEYLALVDRPRKLAVLGLMAELGPEEVRFHEEIGEIARDLEVEIIGVGDLARSYDPDLKAGNPEEAARLVEERLGPDLAVLVKGSRAAGLERVTELVAAGSDPDQAVDGSATGSEAGRG